MGEIKSISEPVWLRDIFLRLSILFHSLQLPSQLQISPHFIFCLETKRVVGRSSQNKDSSLLLSSRSGSNEKTSVTETTRVSE